MPAVYKVEAVGGCAIASAVPGDDAFSVIKMTNKETGEEKTFERGSTPWRMLYFTQFRKNAEYCTPTSVFLPWDVQQDIAHCVWTYFKD